MLDPNGPDTIRLDVADARQLGEATLRRIGFPADEASIITDQLIDNALCGYRFASLPRILAIAEDAKTAFPRSVHSANANSAASRASCWIARSSMLCMHCEETPGDA